MYVHIAKLYLTNAHMEQFQFSNPKTNSFCTNEVGLL